MLEARGAVIAAHLLLLHPDHPTATFATEQQARERKGGNRFAALGTSNTAPQLANLLTLDKEFRSN